MYASSSYQFITFTLGRFTAEPGLVAVVSSYQARSRNWSSATLLSPSQVTEFPVQNYEHHMYELNTFGYLNIISTEKKVLATWTVRKTPRDCTRI